MIYAARNADGAWTGTVYETVTPAISAHHAQYGETLVLIAGLSNVGADDEPVWEADHLTQDEAIAAERAAMRVSRFQARAALHMAGLLPQIEAAVAKADPIVQIAWADAAEWRRDSPALTALASAVGLDDDAIDQLFRGAMQIAA